MSVTAKLIKPEPVPQPPNRVVLEIDEAQAKLIYTVLDDAVNWQETQDYYGVDVSSVYYALGHVIEGRANYVKADWF